MKKNVFILLLILLISCNAKNQEIVIKTEGNIFLKEEKIENIKSKIDGLEKELKNIIESESGLSEYTKQRFITARKLGDEYLKLSDLTGSLLLREKAKMYYRLGYTVDSIGDNFTFNISEAEVPDNIRKIIMEDRNNEYLNKLYKEVEIDLKEAVVNGELTECGNDYCFNFKLYPGISEIEKVSLNYVLNVQSVYITEQDKFKYAKYALNVKSLGFGNIKVEDLGFLNKLYSLESLEFSDIQNGDFLNKLIENKTVNIIIISGNVKFNFFELSKFKKLRAILISWTGELNIEGISYINNNLEILEIPYVKPMGKIEEIIKLENIEKLIINENILNQLVKEVGKQKIIEYLLNEKRAVTIISSGDENEITDKKKLRKKIDNIEEK